MDSHKAIKTLQNKTLPKRTDYDTGECGATFVADIYKQYTKINLILIRWNRWTFNVHNQSHLL